MAREFRLTPRAFRDLRGFPQDDQRAVLATLDRLRGSALPGPPTVKKLRGQDRRFRIRVGHIRIIVEVDPTAYSILRIVSRPEMERILRHLD